MRDGSPNQVLFKEVIAGLLQRASANGRKVRAFGEMMAVLWANGLHDATIRLEHLWEGLCHVEHFSLLCAYPRGQFGPGTEDSISDICSIHSRTVL